MSEYLGIIPARFASSRFPGKPLADIGGKPMIRRVYERAVMALDPVYVATDDQRIADAVYSFGGRVVMTSSRHGSGTERCAEAAATIAGLENRTFDVIINIQGDEPFIRPEQIRNLMSCFNTGDTMIATLVRRAKSEDEIHNPNQPKVVVDKRGEALYFSRSPIPYLRNTDRAGWHGAFEFLIHVGMYGYREDILRAITRLVPGNLERAESLEQLRWLENGYRIKTALTPYETLAVDTPEDLERLRSAGLV